MEPTSSRIEDHPMWHTQIELERSMRTLGLERFQVRREKAEEAGNLTRLRPVTDLLRTALPLVINRISSELSAARKRRGIVPLWTRYIRPDDGEPAADCRKIEVSAAVLIGVRCVLDGLAAHRVGITSLGSRIGLQVEHEAKIRCWERSEPALFASTQNFLDRTGATPHHRERVNIHAFNERMQAGQLNFDWEPWGKDAQRRIGLALIDAVVCATQWFTVEDDPAFSPVAQQRRAPQKVLVPTPRTSVWLIEAFSREAELSPEFRPTVVPPKPWDGIRAGGYWTPWVPTPRLIRFKASTQEQRERVADGYDALDMPAEYAAVHALQNTPWRVNKRVLEVARWAVDHGRAIAGMPSRTPSELFPLPEDEKADPEKLKAWKRARSDTIRADLRRTSDVLSTDRTLRTAGEYSAFERFYFPHMMDFRGRKYPIPVGLQPQGDDLARGLLEFADGAPITEENGGSRWLAIHLASVWGHDKLPFDERAQWVHDNEALFRRVAADPCANLDWAEADKPWQALAAALDWAGFLQHGAGYVSHLSVTVDGTCNGIQHLAALARDEGLARQVNLLPSAGPQDIYRHIAGLLQRELEALDKESGIDADHARYWLRVCGGQVTRSLTKKAVMVMPYGGTFQAYGKSIGEWLKKHDPLQLPAGLSSAGRKEHRELRQQRITFLARRMWYVVKHEAAAAVKLQRWLRDCTKAVCDAGENLPLIWTTPSGFVVRQHYQTVESKKVETRVSGQRIQLRAQDHVEKLDRKAQLDGTAPNFVHSLDAAALTRTLGLCQEAGITDLVAVHDAYGTHASRIDELSRYLRAAFIAVHEAAPLANFRLWCGRVVADALMAQGLSRVEAEAEADRTLPPLPSTGQLDLNEVMNSEYFFS